MGRTIGIVNQKGGVGKTTTAVNLAAGLALRLRSLRLRSGQAGQAGLGRRVLLVDCDPQGNATTGLGVDKNGVEYGLGEVLESASLRVCESGRGEFQVSSFKFQERPEREAVAHGAEHTALRRAIMRTRVEGLDLVPSRLDLAGVELEMAGNRQEAGGSRQERLREALREIKGESAEQRADLRYDYIIIDAPPSLGLLTVNCLVAADSLIIPVQCEYFALEGLKQLREIVGRVREGLNPGLRIEGMLLTMYDGRTRLAVEVAEDMRRHFGNEVFRTVIPRSVRLAEAPSYGMPGVVYAAESAGAMAYMQLAEEIEERSR